MTIPGIVAGGASGGSSAAFRASATGSTGNQTSAATVSATVPASTAAGDLILVFVAQQAGSTAPSFNLAGFTQVRADTSTGAATINSQLWCYRKISDGTEHGATLTATLGGGNDLAAMAVLVYSGPSASTPVQTSSATVSSTTAPTSIATTSLTTLVDKEIVVSAFACREAVPSADTWSTPAGTAPRASDNTNQYIVLAVFDETKTPAGATTARTSSTTGAGGRIAQAIAVQ